jgi:exodeoxyribonuclease VII large subunit
VVPDGRACLEVLERCSQRLSGGMRRELRASGIRLEGLVRRLQLAHPGVRLQQQMQRLDDLMQRLSGAMRGQLHRDGERQAQLRARLLHRSPQHLLSARTAQSAQLAARLERAASERLARAAHRLALAQRGLDAVSPLATLSRGFAIVSTAEGRILTDATEIAPGDEIEARLARGTLLARVTGRK